MYEYRAKVVKVYDGDTITVDLDLGFDITAKKTKLRLANIDAPELRGEDRPAGIASRDRLRELILGKNVRVKTFKDKKGKYGRYIAVVYHPNGRNINQQLVSEGHAIEKHY